MEEKNEITVAPDRTFNIVMYDINEMISILGCSRRTIMTYIKDGKLKCVKVCGKWKISKQNLEDFCNGK